MESLYLLLITNKGSNIVEDLETLRLLAKVWRAAIVAITTEQVLILFPYCRLFLNSLNMVHPPLRITL